MYQYKDFYGFILPPIQPHPSCKKCHGRGEVKDKIGGMMPCARCFGRNGYCQKCFGTGNYFKKFKQCDKCHYGQQKNYNSSESSD